MLLALHRRGLGCRRPGRFWEMRRHLITTSLMASACLELERRMRTQILRPKVKAIRDHAVRSIRESAALTGEDALTT